MFPEIGKPKKKPKIGSEQMIKQCDEALKQIQLKSKKAIKNIPLQLVSDINKVCRLKDIPIFYSHYLLYFIQRSSPQKMTQKLNQQLQKIMCGNSFYQKISSLLKQRQKLINDTKQQLQIVQGFSIMNCGKQIPNMIKGIINTLIRDCVTLDQVKHVQIREVNKLYNYIKELRDNLKHIVQNNIQWEFTIKAFDGINNVSSFQKTKVIYPQSGINCIFTAFYDINFLKSSFMAQEIKFANVQFDPFFLYIDSSKKTTKIIEQNLIKKLKDENYQYKKAEQYIFSCNPKNNIKSQKKIQEATQKRISKSSKKLIRPSSRQFKRSSNKIKQELNLKLINESLNLKNKMHSMKKLTLNIDEEIQNVYKRKKSSQSIYKTLEKSKSKSNQKSINSLDRSLEKARSVVLVQQREVTVSQASQRRSTKNGNQIDRPKSMAYIMSSPNNEAIQNIYKNTTKKKLPANESPIKNSKKQKPTKQQTNQKEILIKQLSKQKLQQQKLKSLIKRVQSCSSNQNRVYQKKMIHYQEQIQLLKSRLQQKRSIKNRSKNDKYNQAQLSPYKLNNNSLINKVYKFKDNLQTNKSPDKPENNLIMSRLVEEKSQNYYLENKVKQLNKEKLKLQQLIEKQGLKINKQKEIYQRKLQKYQQIITNIQNQNHFNKKIAFQVKKKFSIDQSNYNRDKQQKKSAYLSKKQILPKPEIEKQKKSELIQKQIVGQQSGVGNKGDLQITNSRNTIQIVYNQKKRKSKKKQNENEQFQLNKSSLKQSLIKQKQRQYEVQMSRLQKQKILLQRKLDIRSYQKSGTQVMLIKKLQQKDYQLQKYKQQVQKQKSHQQKYQQRMKQLRKKINTQYQQKLQRQKQKFNRQRQSLLTKLSEQKQQKVQKQKHLFKQMIFLKQMQLRENQLIQLMNQQRLQRQQRQQQLQQELQKKQSQLQQYQIQDIKRIIEKQVRQQMNLQDDEEQVYQPNDYLLKKQIIQKQIQSIIQGNDQELQQIDEENQKLKQLIQKIKQEERNIITNIKADVQFDQQQQFNNSYQQINNPYQQVNNYQKINNPYQQINNQAPQYDNNQVYIQNEQNLNFNNESAKQQFNGSRISNRSKNQFLTDDQQKNKKQYKNNNLVQELNHKAYLQIQRQNLKHSRYKQIQQSQNYRDRQKIQNIIQHYLRNPHQYPQSRGIVMKKQQKSDLVKDLVNKNIKAKQFQQQLMKLKNVQNFIPAQRDDDPISSHMLNLRQAYQNQQSNVLKNILFPSSIQDDYFSGQQLSYQEQQPQPPTTLVDHLKIHQQKYLQKSKNKKSNKNFMAINRIKLLQIQQEKKQKQKQRQMIDQQMKKKIRKIKYKSKKKQQIQQKQFQQLKKQMQAKYKKRQDQIAKAQKLYQQDQLKRKKQQQLKVKKKQSKLKASKNNKTQQKDQLSESNNNNTQINETKNNKTETNNKRTQQNKNIIDQSQQNNQFINNQISKTFQNKQKQQYNDINSFQMLQEKQQNSLDIELNKNQSQQLIKQQSQIKQLQKKQNDHQQYQQDDFQQEEQNQFLQLTNDKGLATNDNKTKQQQKKPIEEKKQQQVIGGQLVLASQNIALLQLQAQKQVLKADILSYQQQIRSYISLSTYFTISQHFIAQKQLSFYIKQLLNMSSNEIVGLNNNKTIEKDVIDMEAVVILLAKDQNTQLEIGIGVFHKEYQQGEYVCDFLLAHNMVNFLNLAFNFSRYLYQNDQFSNSTQYIFTLSALQDETSKAHFNEFQQKCKRMGQIYIKTRQNNTRKYVLKRNLFEHVPHESILFQGKGVQVSNKIQIHETLMKQKGHGFINKYNFNYCSSNVLLSSYLKQNSQQLQAFKRRTQDDLRNRETLITAMVFEKKQFTIKIVQNQFLNAQSKFDLYQNVLGNVFNVEDVRQKVQQLSFRLEQMLPKGFKRCLLQLTQVPEPYCIIQFNQPLSQVQASNSSELGTFLPLLPKFKVLILPGQQFLQSSKYNPDLSIFFYTKHFIKNITQVKKQSFSRVYIPELVLENWTYYDDVSTKLQKTVFGKEQIQIGYEGAVNNSVVYTPTHKDFVLQKPFIVSVLSANLQRAIEANSMKSKYIKASNNFKHKQNQQYENKLIL